MDYLDRQSAVSNVDTSARATPGVQNRRRPRSAWSRAKIVIRRIHLYTGLFLLPWVFLYGITAGMFNHVGLFPDATIRPVPADQIPASAFESFPTPEQLARQVVDALRASAPDADIQLAENHGAEFANNIILQVVDSSEKHAIHIDPISKATRVISRPNSPEPMESLLPEVNQIQLSRDPYRMARDSVPEILSAAGIQASAPPRPLGWSKLNFLAEIDGEPARITYVLRDGHIDATRYLGQDGMTARQFLLRLHTSHGQPPHWNGRMYWSLVVDAMSVAMVCWGLTGIFMWWQIKRTRIFGGLVIISSLATASFLYYSLLEFYATTKL